MPVANTDQEQDSGIEVDVPGVGLVTFPDGMSHDAIKSFIAQKTAKPVPVPGGYLPVQPSERAEMLRNASVNSVLSQGTPKPLLTRFRESLSPLLGETESQRLSRPPGALENIE